MTLVAFIGGLVIGIVVGLLLASLMMRTDGQHQP